MATRGDLPRLLEIVRRRDLSCEGIPMFLALEGARPAPPFDPRRRHGARLARALIEIHDALSAEAEAAPHAVQAAEAAAVEGAVPAEEDGFDAEARRAVSAEARMLAEAISVLAYAELEHIIASPDPDHTGSGRRGRPGRAAADAEMPPERPGLLGRALRAYADGRFVTVVNYHNTPAGSAGVVREELAALARRFAPVDVPAMRGLFEHGRWDGERLPLIPVFYEGYRNNHDYGAPACEAAGLVGWFFLITDFLDAEPHRQVTYAWEHHIGLTIEELEQGRVAMSWAEASALGRHHVVVAHTAAHRAAHRIVTPDDVRRELEEPAAKVAAATGRTGVAQAFLFGTGLDSARRHRGTLARLGVRWVFGNLAIDAVTPAEEASHGGVQAD